MFTWEDVSTWAQFFLERGTDANVMFLRIGILRKLWTESPILALLLHMDIIYKYIYICVCMYYTWTPKYLRKKWDNIQLLAWDFYVAWRVQVRKKNWSNWHREIHGSMAMQQEPIYWRYLPSTRPIFQGYVREYPQKIWPEIWYVYVPPSVGSWNSHWMDIAFGKR